MNYLNLLITLLHSPAYVASSPTARATWLNVILWCAQQENGGIVKSAREWKNRQWQQTCGVTAREVRAASNLLTWNGDDLVVWGYPLEQEEVLKAKRDVARANGRGGGRPPAKPTSEPVLVAILEPASESVREGNGMEVSVGKAATHTLLASLVLSDEQIAGVASAQDTTPEAVAAGLATFNGIKANYPGDPRTLEAFDGWMRTSSHGKQIKAKHQAPVVRPTLNIPEPLGWSEWVKNDPDLSTHHGRDWETGVLPYYQRLIVKAMQARPEAEGRVA